MAAMDSQYENSFSSGICDCFAGEDGCKTCCLTYWCPCVQFGLNVERLEPETGAWFAGDFAKSSAMFFGALLAGSLISYSATACTNTVMIAPPLHIFPMMNTRRAIRNKYKIKGNSLGDFCTVFWCSSCVLCQEHRQLKLPAPGDAVGYPVNMAPASVYAPPVATKGQYTSLPVADSMA